jgi:hypothetical protein
MRTWIISFCLASVCTLVHAMQSPIMEQPGINMRGSYIVNMGFIDQTGSTNDFTDASMANYGVSVGQLVGVNPETGEAITNAVNLLPIMVRSALVAGEVNAGLVSGDGSGLTGLNAGEIMGYLPVSSMPTSGVWNVSGLTLKNANFEGPLSVGGEALDVDSDLNVQGTLTGDATGLSNIPAGGEAGSIQFNAEGLLEGNTNFFIHAATDRLASESADGIIFRAYKGNVIADDKLVYVVRRYNETSELSLLEDGQENIRLRGDGSVYIAGSLEVGGDVTFAQGTNSGSNVLYIPQSGDLSMGSYVAQ